ncbi:MAG: N-formylglutamate amidohydrolase [Alphaproteobacteria bacterium]|nr:N-formylglutamate amidohydrolase [Alphaproteobacteria bacterium]
MSTSLDHVLISRSPLVDPAPVVVDSPHSGTDYPPDFSYICDLQSLRQAEDTHVDRLVADAPSCGAWWLAALFPRSYIDPNRSVSDMDPGLLDGLWPEAEVFRERAQLGQGLIRSIGRPGEPVYGRKLKLNEVRHRVAHYYQPYHEALTALVDEVRARFGVVYLLDCHSMPSLGQPADPEGEGPGADFVLGDRDGTTCAGDFTALVEETLTARGYSVARNDPYKGVEIVRRYGKPHRNRHALQLEINRALYMNERTFEKTPGFESLQADLTHLIATLCTFARSG